MDQAEKPRTASPPGSFSVASVILFAAFRPELHLELTWKGWGDDGDRSAGARGAGL